MKWVPKLQPVSFTSVRACVTVTPRDEEYSPGPRSRLPPSQPVRVCFHPGVVPPGPDLPGDRVIGFRAAVLRRPTNPLRDQQGTGPGPCLRGWGAGPHPEGSEVRVPVKGTGFGCRFEPAPVGSEQEATSPRGSLTWLLCVFLPLPLCLPTAESKRTGQQRGSTGRPARCRGPLLVVSGIPLCGQTTAALAVLR